MGWFDEEDIDPRHAYRVGGQIVAAAVIITGVGIVLALALIVIDACARVLGWT